MCPCWTQMASMPGEHARRVLQRTGGMYPGGGGRQDGGPGGMNLPPSITNNPNIPMEVINNLHAGRLGTTVFVANVRNTFSQCICCPLSLFLPLSLVSPEFEI